VTRSLLGVALVAAIPLFAEQATAPSPTVQVPRLQGAQDPRVGSPVTAPDSVEWRFSETQPDWKSALTIAGVETARLDRVPDAVRVILSESSRVFGGSLFGGVYVDLPERSRDEWNEVVVSARTTSSITRMHVGLDLPEDLPASDPRLNPRVNPRGAVLSATFQPPVRGVAPIVRDGLVHSYRIYPDGRARGKGPWRRLGFLFEATDPASIDILSVRVVRAAGGERVITTTLEPPQLRHDFALLRRALEEVNPALYRDTTKREMDAHFARAEATLVRPMTVLQFRNVLTELGAEFVTFQGDQISSLINSAKLFPLALAFDEREPMRAFVVMNHGIDERVKPGMEVLAINGESLAGILRRILPNIGGRLTWQKYALGIQSGFFRRGTPGQAGFSEAYRLYVGDPARFSVSLRDPHTRKTLLVDLAGVTVADAAVNVERNPVNSDVLAGLTALRDFAQEYTPSERRSRLHYFDGHDTAVLIPAFGGSFPEFVEKTFADLAARKTRNLIIDMRGNTGGFDIYPVLLFSYLTSKEFRPWDENRMKTYDLTFKAYTNRREIDPVTDRYYGSAVGIWKADPTGGWLMTEKYGRQYGARFVGTIGVQRPAEHQFDGTVYVLIDGGCISACSDFTGMREFSTRATFVGEETGGLVDSSGAGSVAVTLPESLLTWRIHTEVYFRAVDRTARRRGTLPKYTVVQTVGDLAKGRDTVLEFTRELIRRGR
jgi:hypothetical protein